jgi:hypothetical protein
LAVELSLVNFSRTNGSLGTNGPQRVNRRGVPRPIGELSY